MPVVTSAKVRFITFLYTCATVSLAGGVYGPLAGDSLTLVHGLVASASLVIAVGLAIVAAGIDEWTS
jgi:hypothetical protein